MSRYQMKKKSWFFNLVLLFSSLLFCFITAEIALRIVLFGDIGFLNNIPILARQRNPAYYVDGNSEEEFGKLACHLNRKACGKKEVHPLLGWTGNFSPDNYLHNEAGLVGSRKPVLLYGDSFARCVGGTTCFQDFLDADEEFSKDYYLLNYGVIGYGLDQIYLLLRESVGRYDNPFVIVSLMTEDLDRSSLTYFNSQKPHFEIVNGRLVLQRPLMIEPQEFFSQHPPGITSYLYRRVLYSNFLKAILPEQIISFLKRDEYYIQKKIRINERIIDEIIKELRDRELEFVFLVFHHRGNLYKDDWRDIFIRKMLDEHKVPYIWAKDIVREYDGIRDDPLYIPDGHPADLYNRLISDEIKKVVSE